MKKLNFPKIPEKMRRRFLAGAFAVMTVFVSVMAYLTSTERVTNRFTIGDVKIDLIEPNWPGNADPDTVLTNSRTVSIGDPADEKNVSYADANYILPGEIVPKDPLIVNTGKNDAFVFMKVTVPVYTDINGDEHEVFVVSNDDINAGGYTDTSTNTFVEFSEKFNQVGTTFVENGKWIYLGKGTNADGTADLHTYVFGYKEVLVPEAENAKTADGAGIKEDLNHDGSEPRPYKTDELYKYVMLNPELNGVDPEIGELFYTFESTDTSGDPNYTGRRAKEQDIDVVAYGVQSKFLKDTVDTELAIDNNDVPGSLEKIWNAAGFGDLLNKDVPDAHNHNKYDIPQTITDNNYIAAGNAWTDGDGDPIVSNSTLGTETITVNYYYESGGNNTLGKSVTYKRFVGSETYIGEYPLSDITYYSDENKMNPIVAALSEYLKNASDGNTVNIYTTENDDFTSALDNATTATVDVQFGDTSYTATFTNIIGDDNSGYTKTSGPATFPNAGSGYHWSEAEDGAQTFANYGNIGAYLDTATISGNSITLVKVANS